MDYTIIEICRSCTFNRNDCPIYRCGYCKDEFPLSERKLHASVCPLREFIMRGRLQWVGTSQALKHHVPKHKLRHDSEYFEHSLTANGVEVIESGDDVYAMFRRYHYAYRLFWFCLRLIGPLSYANRRYFEVKLKNGNVEYDVTGTVAAMDKEADWVMIDLRYLGYLTQLGAHEKIKIRVAVRARVPIFPKYALKELLEDMTCPTCKCFMGGDIIQTNEGHSVCSECNVAAPHNKEEVRNLALEFFSKCLIQYRNTQHQKDVDGVSEQLLKRVECPVCLEYMSQPIKVCVSGHSVCGYCRPRCSKCPVCRQKFTVLRNTTLELVCSKIRYCCMYAVNGCTVALLPEKISNHERNCAYNILECPFKNSPVCIMRGRRDEILVHAFRKHIIFLPCSLS